MPNRNQRGRNNNNPEGRNQYTNEWMATAKDHPIATAAAVAGAVGAGVFLWSKRNQVSNQVNRISQTAGEMSRRAGRKASDWIDEMRSQGRDRALGATNSGEQGSQAPRPTGSRNSASQANGGRSRNQAMNASTAGAATAG